LSRRWELLLFVFILGLLMVASSSAALFQNLQGTDGSITQIESGIQQFTLDYDMSGGFLVSPQSPDDGLTTSDNMPDFKFTVVHPTLVMFNCSLWLQNGTSSKVYASGVAVNASVTTLTPSSVVPNGVWQWWINCTGDSLSGVSEKRNITINVFRGEKTFTSTYDGSTRTYWLDLPDNFDVSAPTPLLFFLHGYHGSRLTYISYTGLRQVFQNHTWIVASTDCRTANGYPNWYAEPSRQDITDVLNMLKHDYLIDASHVHVMGNSMGGGGALKYAMFDNQVIASVVDINGVTNFTAFYSQTPTYKASLVASYGGTPSQVPAVYNNESALGNEQRFSHTPVMILHGTADDTISVSQSRNLNQSLSARGYVVNYVELPGVGHDILAVISGREMQIFNWLNDHPMWGNTHLMLTVQPNQYTYAKGQSLTLFVTAYNAHNPALDGVLSLTISGAGEYGYFDFQTVKVTTNGIREYSFDWSIPDVAGTYVVEVGLVPAQLTAYDTAWVKVT
jgi:poly(3-hydroxybutyrate) depolymerase